jgi:putative polyhydroxyalkanoate system protein
MASIEINKPFTMPRDELREQLDQLAAKLGDDLQLKCEWQSDDCLGFKRSGAEGEINIGEAEIGMEVRLGMLMNAFRGPIEKQIQEFLDEHIY